MKFIYDIHAHTSETSNCGLIQGSELVKMYSSAGYSGVVITDHYYSGFFERLGSLDWDRKVELWLTGWHNALLEGNKLGFTVMLGMEITFPENLNDYLVYGIDKDCLLENKELYKLGIKEFLKLALQKGLFISQAHPFRTFMKPMPPELIDAVEVYNGNRRHDSRNHRAFEYAQKNGLFMLSGSDFHQDEDLARGGIITSKPLESSAYIERALQNKWITELVRT